MTYSLFKLYKCVCSEVVLYVYQGRSHSCIEHVYDYFCGELFSVDCFRFFFQIQAAGCEFFVTLHFKVGLSYMKHLFDFPFLC